MNENELLNQAMSNSPLEPRSGGRYLQGSSPVEMAAPSPSQNTAEFQQWQIGPNDTFRPAGTTRETLPVGTYRFDHDPYGIFLQKINVVTDSLFELPDSANKRVLDGMRKFWSMADSYRTHGLLYKRGVLLWGPPGSGKTATLTLLSIELMAAGGIVILCSNPSLTSAGLAQLRRIEPERRLICILEDVDEMIAKYSEHDLLALLDGENQVDNVVMVATTNYPELLGPRIVNRPSRFDERILVGMPSSAARDIYIGKITANGLRPEEHRKWVTDTEGLSVAHIRELAAAVLCLEQPYEEVIERLRSMRVLPKEKDGFTLAPTGFGGNGKR